MLYIYISQRPVIKLGKCVFYVCGRCMCVVCACAKVIEPCRSAGWTQSDVQAFFQAYIEAGSRPSMLFARSAHVLYLLELGTIGRTFCIYLCLLSFWLNLPWGVLSTNWCCPSRPCMVFLACMHLALFLA